MRGRGQATRLAGTVMFLALCAGGCSGAASNSTTLAGSVTLDLKPIAAGTIQFLPEQAGQGAAAGGTIVAGRYRAERVPLGSVRVIVAAVERARQLQPDARGWVDWDYVDLVPADRRIGEVVSIAARQQQLDIAW